MARISGTKRIWVHAVEFRGRAARVYLRIFHRPLGGLAANACLGIACALPLQPLVHLRLSCELVIVIKVSARQQACRSGGALAGRQTSPVAPIPLLAVEACAREAI